MKIEIDKYNSNIFGLKMANILDYKHNLDCIKFNESIKGYKLDHLSVKVNTKDKQVVNFFVKNKFYLVDTQITYRLDIKNKNFEQSSCVRNANLNDIKSISKIAEDSFSIDRFHSDKNLETRHSDNYYKQWAINLLRNQNITSNVYVLNKEIVGFSFWKKENNMSSLILVAVSKDNRGKGIYRKMISHYLAKNKNEIDKVYMGTQIENYPVHKTWINFGAIIIGSEYVLHRKEKKDEQKSIDCFD